MIVYIFKLLNKLFDCNGRIRRNHYRRIKTKLKAEKAAERERQRHKEEMAAEQRRILYILGDTMKMYLTGFDKMLGRFMDVSTVKQVRGHAMIRGWAQSKFKCGFVTTHHKEHYIDLTMLYPDATVILCWNGKVSGHVIDRLAWLKERGRPFYLYTYWGGNSSMELVRDFATASFGVKVLTEQAEAALRTERIKYHKKLSESGSGTVYLITNKWLKVRISDHPSNYLGDEPMNLYNMGLFKGADGMAWDFKRWLAECSFERDF